MKSYNVNSNRQHGIAVIVIIAIIALLGGIGTYVVVKEKSQQKDVENTPVSQEDLTVGQAEGATGEVATSGNTGTETPIETGSTPKSTALAPIGDYEVRILSPLPNTKFYTGQTIHIKVQTGKYIPNILFVKVGVDVIKNTADVLKASDGTFNFDYVVKPTGQILTLGDT